MSERQDRLGPPRCWAGRSSRAGRGDQGRSRPGRPGGGAASTGFNGFPPGAMTRRSCTLTAVYLPSVAEALAL